jgi:hypothetical protein
VSDPELSSIDPVIKDRGVNAASYPMKFLSSICIVLSLFVSLSAFAAERILFIRGGDGTGGFLEGGGDDHLCDIDNFNLAGGNHGWAELTSLLRGEGYIVTQIKEGAATAGADLPVDLVSLDLSPYKLIVFGSNNATYGTAAVNKIESFVRNGGGVLFISDANFGSSWGAIFRSAVFGSLWFDHESGHRHVRTGACAQRLPGRKSSDLIGREQI